MPRLVEVAVGSMLAQGGFSSVHKPRLTWDLQVVLQTLQSQGIITTLALTWAWFVNIGSLER